MPTSKAQLPWVRYWDEAATCPQPPGGPFQVDDACIVALQIFGAHSPPDLFGGNPLACDPDRHADAQVIREWLASKSRDPSDLQVIFWFAYFARNEWARRPKRTRTQHRALYRHIRELSTELRAAMDATGSAYLGGHGHGFVNTSLRALLTDDETDAFISSCNIARGVTTTARSPSARERLVWEHMFGALPTMQELLVRMTTAALRLEVQGPIHAQPKKRGAERGYFVRRIAQLFQRRYGEQPHEVIAALATIALGGATDRELVAKLLA
ncbi:MAG: hypothetical protein ACREPY_15080 [Rhodanobacteraceae bacterium]